MPALSSQQLQQIQLAVYNKVDKKAKQKRLNSKKRPLHAYFISIMQPTSLEGGSLTYKNTVESAIQETTWVGDDVIEASEPDFQLDLTFGYFNYNIAVKILHDQLKRLGFSIMPNGEANNIEDRTMSKDEALKLINYVKKLTIEAMDAYDRRLDLIFHRTGSQSATVQPGIFGILSQSNSTGSIGGKLRSAYPVLRHVVKTAMTGTAGGTMRADMDRVVRTANLYGVNGGVPGELDKAFAGQVWIETWKAYAELNQLRIDRPTASADLKKLDAAISDASTYCHDIPVVYDPTMETIDALDTYSPTATKTAFFLNSETWQIRNENGLHKYASSPDDVPNQRITRQDLDGTYSIGCDAPASNANTAVA